VFPRVKRHLAIYSFSYYFIGKNVLIFGAVCAVGFKIIQYVVPGKNFLGTVKKSKSYTCNHDFS